MERMGIERLGNFGGWRINAGDGDPVQHGRENSAIHFDVL